jgi:hypothetical protein
MTEPIKLPQLQRPPIHLSGWTNELCEWAKGYARLAVEQAVAAEREACAKVCDEQYPYSVFHTDQRAAKNCAAAIRARGDK